MDKDEIHHPHDKLFKAAFGTPENTAAFLEATLDSSLSRAIDWSELSLLPDSFIDSHYRQFRADLLFSVPVAGSNAFLYLLFEHQSSFDPALPVRLLRYLTRIWETFIQNNRRAKLPVILPVVLSQSAEARDLAPELLDLMDVPEELRKDLTPFVPNFRCIHLQLAEMDFDAIPGTPSGIYVLRVMKAERLRKLLDDAVWDAALIQSVPRQLVQMVFTYMLQGDVDRDDFVKKVQEVPDPEIQSDAMTLAEQFHEAGRQEGRQEDILEALRIRFEEVPEGLEETVRSIQDEARLTALHRASIRCESLEDFADAL